MVLDKKQTKHGMWNYRCGLLKGIGEYTNVVEVNGKEYVDLKWSFNTPVGATKGDVLTVEVEEVILQDEELNWLGPTVVDVDRTRKQPYYTQQVVGMAKRGHILQDARGQQASESLAMRQLFGSPGGKHFMASRLVRMIPEHETYVEPFAGGLAVFFAKEPSKKEVVGDLDPNVAWLYKFIQGASDEQLSTLAGKDWIGSEPLFKKLVNSKPEDGVARAYRLLYIWHFGFMSGTSAVTDSNFRHADTGVTADFSMDRLTRTRERLRNVVVLHQNALGAIKQYDSPTTFFYLDPPYPGSRTGGLWKGDLDRFDIDPLLAALRGLKGKFLLSLDSKTGARVKLLRGWHRKTITTRHSAVGGDKSKAVSNKKAAEANRRKVREVVIANYPLGDIRKQQAKDDEEDWLEEGLTRGEKAERFWKEHWQECYPKDGKFEGVYHHHWRGLSEDDTDLPDEIKKRVRELLEQFIASQDGGAQLTPSEIREMNRLVGQVSRALPSEDELLKTDHSVHGDARMTFDDALFGKSIFLGEASDLRGGRDLYTLKPDDALEIRHKLIQPIEWLTIAKRKPWVGAPGKAGSTSHKWSKFFEVAHYHGAIGVWREHFQEVFITDSKLKGRYLYEYAMKGGERYWQVVKAENETPYADTHSKEEVIRELKSKGQKWLVWAKPGVEPELIEVAKWKPD